MRSVLKTGGRRWNLGWLLPLVLLALPNCMLSGGPYEPDPNAPNFSPGENPTSAIMCEIPVPLSEDEDECATDEELLVGIPMEEAATALNTSQANPIMLDFSTAAQEACGDGRARKKKFYGTWPDGLRVCLNCDLIPNIYGSPTDVCVAKCKDLLEADELLLGPSETHELQHAFCLANAKVAINVEPDTICFEGACQGDGTENPAFVDPRRSPEPILWTDHIGTDDDGGTTNNLERIALTSGGATEHFDAGAASKQIIPRGDAWVEFSAGIGAGGGTGTDKVHVLGVRSSVTAAGEPCLDPIKCPDTDPHIETVGFAIDLNSDGMVYILEPNAADPANFGVVAVNLPYAVGDRFRVKVSENTDGTATISYARFTGCPDACTEEVFYTTDDQVALYPLRVDTTFREQGARIENVIIMRIKK
jgi:hypothetical protein